MSMPISSVVSGVSYAPPPDISRVQVKSAEIKAAIDQFAASLPGNSGQVDSGDSGAQAISRAAADFVQVSQAFNKKLQFIVDQQSNEVIVKVIDRDTDKVIKVLPPEELQRLHRKLRETIGFLFNERV